MKEVDHKVLGILKRLQYLSKMQQASAFRSDAIDATDAPQPMEANPWSIGTGSPDQPFPDGSALEELNRAHPGLDQTKSGVGVEIE